MLRIVNKGVHMVSLQLRMTEENREMIKADARALGMNPTDYVVMVCSLVNESARELAAGTFVDKMTETMLRGLGVKEKPSE